jgi:hypothetical protein
MIILSSEIQTLHSQERFFRDHSNRPLLEPPADSRVGSVLACVLTLSPSSRLTAGEMAQRVSRTASAGPPRQYVNEKLTRV